MTSMRNGITIVGDELVPVKVLDFIECLTSSDHYKGDVVVIIFEENPQTSSKFGEYFDPGRVVMVNIQKHWKNVIDKAMDLEAEESGMAMNAHLWLSLINTIVHEMLHNESFRSQRENETPAEEDLETMEEIISEEASALIATIATKHDMEAPAIAEYGFIDAAAHIRLLAESKDQWARNQKTMRELHLVYQNDEEQVYLKSIREYLTAAHPNEEWPDTALPLVEPPALVEEKIIDETPATADDQLVNDVATQNKQSDEIPYQGSNFNNVSLEHELLHGDYDDIPMDPMEPTASPNGFTQNTGFGSGGQGNPGLGNYGVTPIPQLTLQSHEIVQAMNELLNRMFNRMFNDCGFRAGMDNAFAAPQNVYEPMFIGDIPNLDKLLLTADMEDATGYHKGIDIWTRSQNPQLAGTLSGIIFKKEAKAVAVANGGSITEYPLPGFKFTINKNGIPAQRLFIAQNVNKINQGGTDYSNPALEARAGSRIAWLMDIDPVRSGKPAIAKMVNGQIEML